MRRSDAHEYRQAYNAQAVVCAEGSQLILATAVATLKSKNIEPLVAIGRTQPHRPYDFRPQPQPTAPRRSREPWRLDMKAKQETPDAKARYALRKQTVEPVFGIIKAALGFTCFHLRGIANVAAEWNLIALACNCRRLHRLRLA